MRRKTEEEKAWLMENAPLHSHAETLDLFEQRFGWRISRASLANWMSSNGLVSSTRAGYVKWDEEKDAYFREIVPGHSESEIRELFKARFGIVLTEGQIGNRKTVLGVKSGTVGGRFDASSGGFKSEEHKRRFLERGAASRFRRGNLPHNAVDVPIGTERVNLDGYVEVKVAERKTRPNSNDNWKAKHRLVWERANGRPIPKGHVIAFMDRDKQNFDPGNLACVSQSEWSVLNKLDYYDKESFEAALTTARLTAKISEIEKRDRSCKRCGAEFKPRYKSQRTCDACLGRRDMREPTEQQRMVLEFFRTYESRHGEPPTIREAANALGQTTANLYQHMKLLERKGFMKRDGRSMARSWRTTGEDER